MRTAAVERDAFVRVPTEATDAMEKELVVAANVVKVLGSLVVKQVESDPHLIAGWRQAKHAKAKTGVPRGTVRNAIAGTIPAAA